MNFSVKLYITSTYTDPRGINYTLQVRIRIHEGSTIKICCSHTNINCKLIINKNFFISEWFIKFLYKQMKVSTLPECWLRVTHKG